MKCNNVNTMTRHWGTTYHCTPLEMYRGPRLDPLPKQDRLTPDWIVPNMSPPRLLCNLFLLKLIIYNLNEIQSIETIVKIILCHKWNVGKQM